MRFASVVDLVDSLKSSHAAFLHYADARRIFLERARRDLVKAAREEIVYHSRKSLAHISARVMLGVERVAHFDDLAVDLGVVDKTYQPAVKVDPAHVSVALVRKIAYALKKRVCTLAVKVGEHIGRLDLVVSEYRGEVAFGSVGDHVENEPLGYNNLVFYRLQILLLLGCYAIALARLLNRLCKYPLAKVCRADVGQSFFPVLCKCRRKIPRYHHFHVVFLALHFSHQIVYVWLKVVTEEIYHQRLYCEADGVFVW